MRRAVALLGAAHPGPAFAVTLLAGLLAGAVGLGPGRIALVVAAVLTGQLSIGWSNDLIDLARDRAVGREDKPLVDGRVSERTVRIACGLAAIATVPLSLACGWVAGLVHLVCVASGWAYNLGAKSTPWSWLPYAVAFGGLPVFVSLTDNPDQVPPLWLPIAGALLGVGAHFVNVLPDLADDAATGVRGLPHRLGARRSQVVAAAVLGTAAVVIVVGAPVDSVVVAVVALVATAGWPPSHCSHTAGRRSGPPSPWRWWTWPCWSGPDERPLGRRRRGRRPGRRDCRALCLACRPGAARAAPGPVRLPARQVLRRRHRPALLREAGLDRRHRRRGRLDPADPARAGPRRRVGRRDHGPAGLRHPARGLRRPAGGAGRRPRRDLPAAAGPLGGREDLLDGDAGAVVAARTAPIPSSAPISGCPSAAGRWPSAAMRRRRRTGVAPR